MRKLALILLLATGSAFADGLYPDDNVVFQAQDHHEVMTITWHVVDDIGQACNTLWYGKKPYNSGVAACAWYHANECHIYTQHKLDLAVLGHEIRHCYEGEWHE